MEKPTHYLLLVWLSWMGLLAFAVAVAFDQGLAALLLQSDRSRISLLIGLLYLLGTLHCARRVFFVSTQLALAERAELLIKNGAGKPTVQSDGVAFSDGTVLPAGFFSDYMLDVLRGSSNDLAAPTNEHNTLPEVYESKLNGPHELGWFLADIMLKLGLLGTIVGFILMLSSVAQTSTIDANTMQNILRQMSGGMGTALYTTLAGLLGSVTMAVQYQMLNRGSDELLTKTVHCAEVHIRRQHHALGA